MGILLLNLLTELLLWCLLVWRQVLKQLISPACWSSLRKHKVGLFGKVNRSNMENNLLHFLVVLPQKIEMIKKSVFKFCPKWNQL